MRRIENVIPCKHLGGDGLCDIDAYGHCLLYKRAYLHRRYHGEPVYKAAHLENFTHRYHHDKEFRDAHKKRNKAARTARRAAQKGKPAMTKELQDIRTPEEFAAFIEDNHIEIPQHDDSRLIESLTAKYGRNYNYAAMIRAARLFALNPQANRMLDTIASEAGLPRWALFFEPFKFVLGVVECQLSLKFREFGIDLPRFKPVHG